MSEREQAIYDQAFTQCFVEWLNKTVEEEHDENTTRLAADWAKRSAELTVLVYRNIHDTCAPTLRVVPDSDCPPQSEEASDRSRNL